MNSVLLHFTSSFNRIFWNNYSSAKQQVWYEWLTSIYSFQVHSYLVLLWNIQLFLEPCKKINQKFESIVTMKNFNHEFISLPIYKIVLMTATGITCQNSVTFPWYYKRQDLEAASGLNSQLSLQFWKFKVVLNPKYRHF